MKRVKPSGEIIQLYMSAPINDWIEEQARIAGTTVNAWIKGLIIAHAPAAVQKAAEKAARGAGRQPVPVHSKPVQEPPKAAPGPSFDDQVEANREKVLDLDARGYLENSIAAITKLPFKVVQQILTSKPTPKKRP
jgi:hypothetical protein